MKKIMTTVAAIVCCMVVQAQSIEENLKAYNDTVVAISNQIVKTEKAIADLTSNTNMTAETKASLMPAEQNKLKTLREKLDAAKANAKDAKEELETIKGFSTEKLVDTPAMSLEQFSAEDVNYLVKIRYDKGERLYRNKWFSSKDDVMNHTTLRGIAAESNTKIKAALLYQYLDEQL